MTLTCEIMKMNDCGRGLHAARLCCWLISPQGDFCRALWAGNKLSLAIKKYPYSARWGVIKHRVRVMWKCDREWRDLRTWWASSSLFWKTAKQGKDKQLLTAYIYHHCMSDCTTEIKIHHVYCAFWQKMNKAQWILVQSYVGLEEAFILTF